MRYTFTIPKPAKDAAVDEVIKMYPDYKLNEIKDTEIEKSHFVASFSNIIAQSQIMIQAAEISNKGGAYYYKRDQSKDLELIKKDKHTTLICAQKFMMTPNEINDLKHLLATYENRIVATFEKVMPDRKSYSD